MVVCAVDVVVDVESEAVVVVEDVEFEVIDAEVVGVWVLGVVVAAVAIFVVDVVLLSCVCMRNMNMNFYTVHVKNT